MDAPQAPAPPSTDRPVSSAYRHALPVRLTHWLNLVVLLVLLMSGLQIFNAHPALYWGERSDAERAWLTLEARPAADGELVGVTRVLGQEFATTGVLGVSRGVAGGQEIRGFPRWATLPSDRWLAMGRRWHLFFAWLFVINGLVYLSYAVVSGHLRRDLIPGAGEFRHLGRTLASHLRLRRLRADAEAGYNTLQKLTYLLVILVLAPLVVLTGLAMSPWLNAVFPWLVPLFDGRQSARSIHFLVAFAFVVFTVVHVTMVILVGPVNHLRAMITGRLRLKGAGR